MRIGTAIGLATGLLLASESARADLRKPIAGAAPILEPRMIPPDGQPAPEAKPLPVVWVPPLMTHTLTQAEKTAELSADFSEVILRIEGLYDPTRLDGTGLAPRMGVRAGTASMNNVFGDRWSIADTDANVQYSVRYIAYAWQKNDIQDCNAFGKRRFVNGTTVVGAMERGDCVRLRNLAGHRDDQLVRLAVVAAVLPVPAFAAPEPGARMSSHDFWVAQEERIRVMKANLDLQRQGRLFSGAAP